MNVGNFKRLSKQDLIYKILDQQALTPAAADNRSRAAPAAARSRSRSCPGACCSSPRPPGPRPPPGPQHRRAAFFGRSPARCQSRARPPREPRREADAARCRAAEPPLKSSTRSKAWPWCRRPMPPALPWPMSPCRAAPADAPAADAAPSADQQINGAEQRQAAPTPPRPDRRPPRAGRPRRPPHHRSSAPPKWPPKKPPKLPPLPLRLLPPKMASDAREGNRDNRREFGGNGFADRRENRADRFERDNREPARWPRPAPHPQRPAPRKPRATQRPAPRKPRAPQRPAPRKPQRPAARAAQRPAPQPQDQPRDSATAATTAT